MLSTPNTITSTDGGIRYSYLDIDSDNDGITDNVEAQTTQDYIAPTGVDSDGDGLDDAYDQAVGVLGSVGLIPVDTDSDTTADYLDLDSDNDGVNDVNEAGHGVDQATIDASGDSDQDGLRDAVDDVVGFDVNDNDFNAGAFTLADSDNDILADGSDAVPTDHDLDYRDDNYETAIGGDTSGTGDEDTTITGTLTAFDTDGLSDGTVFSVSINASNGVASIDPASGAWSYTPTTNYNGTDSFTVTITDDDDNTTTQVINLTIDPVNDAPILENQPGGGTRFESDTFGTFVDGGVTITDVDSLDFDGGLLSVTISGNAETGDRLQIEDGNGVSVSGTDVYYDFGSGAVLIGNVLGGTDHVTPLEITFNTDANVSAVETVAQQVVFLVTSDNPTSTARVVSMQVTDGDGGTSEVGTRTLNVVPVNDDPSNDGSLPTDVTVTEGTSSDIDLSPVNLADVDANGGNLSLTLSTSTGGTLTAASGGGIIFGNNGTNQITLNGTLTELNNYLNTPSNIQYIHSDLNLAGNDADTITVSINDLGNTGTGGGLDITLGTVNVDIREVNDAPTLTATALNPTFTEGDAGVGLFGSVTVDTIESGQTIDELVFTVDNVTDGGDELVTLDGSTFALVDLVNGTSTTNGYDYSVSLVGTTATVTLTTIGATPANISTLGTSINYRNTSEDPTTSDRVFTITSLTDSGGVLDGGIDTSLPNLSSTVTLVTVNDAPVLITNNPLNVPEESTRTITSANLEATDVDNAPNEITYTLTSLASGGSVRLDGSTLGLGDTFTQEDINNNLVTYRDADDGESTSFDFTISDGTNTSSDITFSINGAPINDAPVNTVPGTQTVLEDTQTAISGVSVSDIDANGATISTQLTVSNGILDVSLSGSATISSGAIGTNTLTINGTVSDINSTLSSLEYTGNTNLNGLAADTLTITTNDLGNTGSGGALSDTDTVQIDITPVNDAPVLDPIGNQSVNELETLTFTATASDSDIPADTLTFSLDATSLAAGMSIDANTGVFTWTPTESDGNTTPNVTVTVTDSGTGNLMDSETFTITVNDTNTPPVLDPIGDQSVNELETLTFTATASDSDIPADTLTFSLDATSLAAGMSIDASTGVFTWTPTESDGNTTPNVTVTVTDSGTGNLMDSETFTITVNDTNTAPVLDPIGDQSVNELETLTFTATASDSDIPADTLTFSLDATSLAAGMSIDASTGVFTWTPTESDGNTTPNVTVTVTDSGTGNLMDSETFTITVNDTNTPPVLDPIGDQSVNELETLTFTATASDSDIPADTLTFSLDATSLAAGMSIDASTGVFTWTPTESDGNTTPNVTVTVTDSVVQATSWTLRPLPLRSMIPTPHRYSILSEIRVSMNWRP